MAARAMRHRAEVKAVALLLARSGGGLTTRRPNMIAGLIARRELPGSFVTKIRNCLETASPLFSGLVAQAPSTGVMSASARLLRQAPGSAYIHIPFCRSKCFYCDFAVTPIGSRSSAAADGLKTKYVCQRPVAVPIIPHPHRTPQHSTPVFHVQLRAQFGQCDPHGRERSAKRVAV